MNITYYRIVSPDEGKNIMMTRDSNHEIFDDCGISIDENKIELPFKIKMLAGKECKYDRYTPEYITPSIQERLNDYYSESSLMSPELVNALRSAGVGNLQTFPVDIKDTFTGEVLGVEYLLVHVAGLVSCADMGSSEHLSIGSKYYFHKLKIDQEKTKGLKMFRLAESHSEIIVEEKVANVINSGKFAGIAAEPCN
ncbi:imm11 family protein [Aquimarina sediminis]|uniref:imm11 family protein n=1 Tax=Aquimarina sediminis TaxID=2070536 RepID=UPI000CA07175|nr:DUF1629 domain-containing protein [Aquimarina sediminis]